jgi:hypothetical protein
MYDFDLLKEQLATEVVDIEFVKADGTVRQMKATLDPSVLPTPVATDEEINRNRKKNEEVVVVWDVESNGWRSFRKDRLRSVNSQYIMTTKGVYNVTV